MSKIQKHHVYTVKLWVRSLSDHKNRNIKKVAKTATKRKKKKTELEMINIVRLETDYRWNRRWLFGTPRISGS